MTRKDVVDKVRELVGRTDSGRPSVRWRHQGRNPACGLDCAGVVVWVARSLGISDADYTNYQRFPDGKQLMAFLNEHMLAKNFADALPGDVVLLRDAGFRWPIHVGVLVDNPHGLGIVHSMVMVRGVVEQRLPDEWTFKVVRCYAYPGVGDQPWPSC